MIYENFLKWAIMVSLALWGFLGGLLLCSIL